MDRADFGSEGGAIKALGSLFKLTQVHLWDAAAQVSNSAQLSGSFITHEKKSAEADELDGFDLVPTTEDHCGLLPEDMEVSRQMSALGLPLSFHTNKVRNGPVKAKRMGTKLKHPDSFLNPMDKALCKVSSQMVVSNPSLHDKTSSSLSCLSMLGESELSCYDDAVDVDVSQCVAGEGDYSSTCTRIADGVDMEQNDDDMYEATINDVQNDDFSTNNIISSGNPKIALGLNGETFARSLWGHPDINHCEGETGDELVGHKDTELESICYDDGTTSWQQWAHESVSFPINLEGSGCERIYAQSKSSDEFGDWMVCWDTLYMRNYFYNIKTNASVWDPPPGMEHLATVGCTEVNDTATQNAAKECGSQSKTNSLDGTLIHEKLMDKPHDECLAEIRVAVDSLVPDVTVHAEGQSLDHLDECLEINNCSDRDSFCSVPETPEQITSFHERSVKGDSECNDAFLENMVPAANKLDTGSDPSSLKQKKKVKGKRRQRRLYSQTEGLQSQEMHEEYSAAIAKYWCQRYILFSRYDDGIKMDEEGWFSVTPESIARHQALRCAGGIIVDCFTGVGGNAIQFAQRCKHVVAIDIDQQRINYARHNAAIYRVDNQIDFIMGDFFLLAPKLKADTVFLSPPWGGPDYTKIVTYDINMLKPFDGYVLFNVAKEVASRVVMFLPRNIDLDQLAELSLSVCPPWSLEVEKTFLNGKLKAITAYFSDTSVAGW